MKRAFLFLLVACLAFGYTGCTQKAGNNDTNITIISKGYQQDFWRTVQLGTQKAAADLGVKATFTGPETETEIAKQVDMVYEAINQKASVIVLAALDKELLVPVVEKAKKANIPVLTFDSSVDGDVSLSFIATDNAAAGGIAGEQMAKLTASRGKVAVISHSVGGQTAIDRVKGFKDAVGKYPEIQITNTYYSDGDRAKAKAITKDILADHPDISGIYATNEGSAVGVADAIKETGNAGKVSVIGFDSSEAEIKYINEGVLTGIVVQTPYQMGYMSVKKAVALLNGEKIQKRIDTGATYIDKSNITTPEAEKLLYPLGKK